MSYPNLNLLLQAANRRDLFVSLAQVKEGRWHRYRVWKPLALQVLAGLTPPEWEITIVDENLGVPDYPTRAITMAWTTSTCCF